MRFFRFFLPALVGVSLITSALCAPAYADDASALLAKHKAFVGWSFGDGSITSLALEGTYTTKSGHIEDGDEFRAGLVYRRDLRESTGFTGHVFWSTTQNGFTVPIIGDKAKAVLAMDALMNEGTSELPATLGGTATIDGKSYAVLHVTMQGAAPMDVYEDADTGAYRRVVIDPSGNFETRLDVLSYLDVAPGKKIIGSWIENGSGTFAYTKATPNRSLSNETFHPPASVSTWQFANANPFKIIVNQGNIELDAKVNGVPGRFILDTGASGIVLNDDFANKLGLKVESASRFSGVAGLGHDLVRTINTFEIGGNTLSNVVVTTVNNPYTRQSALADFADGAPPNGYVGFDLLAGAIVKVSTSGATMTILDPSTQIDRSVGLVVTPDLSEGVPILPMQIDKHWTVDTTLDTGNDYYVIFSQALQEHAVHMVIDESNEGRLAAHLNFIAPDGSEEIANCASINSLSIGPIVYQNPRACAVSYFPENEAIVGFDFLRHFDYIFDYPHGIIVMTPHQDGN